MKRYGQVSAFILTGGASSRMGKPKGLLEFGAQPLILRTVRLVEPLVFAVTTVGAPERYATLGLHVIADRQFATPDSRGGAPGPLAGIASALTSSPTEWNLILACDLPYLTAEWVDWLLARAKDCSRQIVMPRTAGGLEPLAAVYRRECAGPIVAALRRGIRKVTEAMGEFRIEIVTARDWQPIHPNDRVLRNMNTREDYEEARRWLEEAKDKAGS
jgi:molybdopterin-guanine dinucleotide biosynthesis protein A